jgi:serine protease AprX
VLAALFLTFIWLAPSTAVAKPHNQQGQQKHAGEPGSAAKSYKVDRELESRGNDSRNQFKTTRVIVTFAPGATLPNEFKRFVARLGNDRNTLLGNNNSDNGGKLNLINGQVLELPNGVIKKLAAHPSVFRLHYDRPTAGHNYRTAVTVGARAVQDSFGYSGAGVGIAIIDSGITSWHDDLTNTTSKLFPYGNQRVDKFVDFVNGRTLPYDDNGHGTHVAGIIGGNGYDSFGEKRGIAPRASLISLKVLDQDGRGTISNIIAALGWVAQNAATYHIRVVNMSVGAGVHESYWTDPLTLACKALTDQGIVVVAAAGNLGKNAAGALQWGGITAPGNAPWVLTVGASSTMGTLTRSDDQMAGYSSSGPTHLDYEAKPDLVAPGTGTVSLAVPGSTFYANKAPFLLSGSLLTGFQPYLALSGTSMAAPVVSGTVALMLQANPNLTPNLVKAILQYTAEQYAGYSPLRQGAGFLNSLGAVGLAWYYKYSSVAPPAGLLPRTWSRQIIWGNHRVKGGFVTPAGNAWGLNVRWGAAKTDGLMGDNIVWGTTDGDNMVWGTSIIGDNVTWGTADGDNVVWGTDCGGADCDNIVWGTIDTALGDNIVWGTAALGDNVIWGTALGDPMLGDNIVWGTSGKDVTWGSSAEDAPVYPDDASEPLPSLDLEFGDVLPLAPVVTPTTQPGPVSIGGVL